MRIRVLSATLPPCQPVTVPSLVMDSVRLIASLSCPTARLGARGTGPARPGARRRVRRPMASELTRASDDCRAAGAAVAGPEAPLSGRSRLGLGGLYAITIPGVTGPLAALGLRPGPRPDRLCRSPLRLVVCHARLGHRDGLTASESSAAAMRLPVTRESDRTFRWRSGGRTKPLPQDPASGLAVIIWILLLAF